MEEGGVNVLQNPQEADQQVPSTGWTNTPIIHLL